jgi:hypothetical protein
MATFSVNWFFSAECIARPERHYRRAFPLEGKRLIFLESACRSKPGRVWD